MTGRRERRRGDVEDRYRHVRHHPVFGGRCEADEAEGNVTPLVRPGRRAASGPRPARPAGVAVPTRPVQPGRPAGGRPAPADGAAPSCGPVEPAAVRLLRRGVAVDAPLRDAAGGPPPAPAAPPAVRRAQAGPSSRRLAVRRAVASAVLVVVAALAVVALGLVADAVSGSRAPAPPPVVTVTVDAPGTVWDVAGRMAPGAGPAERAALAGRIVNANALSTAAVTPGEVLRVPLR